MALRPSLALRNFMLQHGSMADALAGGKLQIYSGAQPASAEAAPSGTLLAEVTDASGALTNEVLASGSVTLDAGTDGSVDGITVDGVEVMSGSVAFVTDLAGTAAAVADNINDASSSPDYVASASGAVITISAARGTGASANALVVASTVTATITSTDADLAGGVDGANGLLFGSAAGGAVSKASTQTWSGVASATGTAGWFRIVGAIADSEGVDSSEEQVRLDGNISNSGSELNMTNLSVTSGATQTVSAFAVTFPTA